MLMDANATATSGRTCSSLTAAGKPCAYPALPGSDPPRCSLHGRAWRQKSDRARAPALYDRYLRDRYGERPPAVLDQAAIEPELQVARALAGQLLEKLSGPAAKEDAARIYAPILLRNLKLIFDMVRYREAQGMDNRWDDVLDRLADELDVDI